MPVHFDEDKQIRRGDELRKKEAERFATLISSNTGVPYIDLSLVSISPDALGLVEEKVAREAKLAVFHDAGKNISVAAFSPTDPRVLEIMHDLEGAGFVTTLYVATENSLERAWKYYEDIHKIEATKIGQIDISNEALSKFAERIKTLEDTKKLTQETLSSRTATKVTAMLEIILGSAIALGASDIHLEPEEKEVRARFRLDGILHDITSFDAHTYKLVLSRVKLLSALKLNVESARQDGRFSVEITQGGKLLAIDIRTSIIPGAYGESAVMRILNPESIKVTLDKLGMSPTLLEIMRNEIKKPNGMILNTGPTGSGKTTTLYTFLQESNEPGVKIITIEDPIEYHVEGVVQTQVNDKKGYSFAEGLKSAMRQDPDIIMVGEIRDNDTASTAIDASLTGHLVFSTLHTNNAAGTIPRLVDLGVNPKVLGPALNVAMAQRLVRTLCNICKKKVAVTAKDKAIIDRRLKSLQEIGINKKPPDTISAPVGCDKCSGTGYKGRIGIFEVILVDEALEKIIPDGPSESEVWKVARAQKIPDMAEDGILKVLDGLTTIEELERVVDLS
ncbi:MAG TPA: GspE/PulE family protein [Candidatus Paceibacterota bacterium]